MGYKYSQKKNTIDPCSNKLRLLLKKYLMTSSIEKIDYLILKIYYKQYNQKTKIDMYERFSHKQFVFVSYSIFLTFVTQYISYLTKYRQDLYKFIRYLFQSHYRKSKLRAGFIFVTTSKANNDVVCHNQHRHSCIRKKIDYT